MQQLSAQILMSRMGRDRNDGLRAGKTEKLSLQRYVELAAIALNQFYASRAGIGHQAWSLPNMPATSQFIPRTSLSAMTEPLGTRTVPF
jgi:hypothetical protein